MVTNAETNVKNSMRGLVRILIMFGPMIFRQIQKFQRSRSRQVVAPQQPQRQPKRQNQAPVQEEEYYEEELPEEGDFVDPINN